jgi:hypothetical protein
VKAAPEVHWWGVNLADSALQQLQNCNVAIPSFAAMHEIRLLSLLDKVRLK